MNINLTMIGQLIMFAMFTWFCMKFVWPPIVAAMEERKKRIESGLRGEDLFRNQPIRKKNCLWRPSLLTNR
jgi:F-type H+-transporting ATPase subunit b